MLFKGNLTNNVLVGVEEIEWLKITGKSGTADRPGGFVLQANAAGVLTDYYFWVDQDGNLRMHTSKPTDEDANGSVVSGVSNAGASLALDNLVSVAVNTDIVSDTDSTDDLGSSSIYWAETYTDKILFNSTATIDGAGAGVLHVVGKVTVGVSDTGHDVQFFGATAGSFLLWDESDDALELTDSTYLKFGDGADILMDFDGTNFDLDAAADDTIFQIGAASDVDVRFVSHDNANQDAGWIADSYTFQVCDSAILQIGGGAFDTLTDGVQISFDGTNTLNIEPVVANDVVRIGETTNADFYLDGANYDCYWDASQNAYVFNDATELCFGASLDIYMRYEGGGNTLDIGQTADGTGSVDFIDCPVLMTGANSAGVLLTIAGNDTTGNTDTVSITHKGTGAGIKVACGEADSVAAEFVTCAAQTTPVVWIDGATGADWDGANDKGMLYLTQDTPHIHAGASCLLVANSGQNIVAAEGSCARFLDTGTARASTYGVEIHSTNNTALHLTTGAVAAKHLVATAYAAQTSSLIVADGATNDWDGADNVGMVHVTQDAPAIHAGATLIYAANSGKNIAAAEGSVARFLDTGAATATTYGVEIHSTNNTALHLTVGATTASHLRATALEAQTAALVTLDASTGTGWDGADNIGVLNITSDSVLVHNGASLMTVQSSAQQKDGSEGALARFLNTGTAREDAVMVEIAAKDSTECALNCSAGSIKATEFRHTPTTRTATDAGGGTAVCVQGETFLVVDETTGDDGDILQMYAAKAGMIVWVYNTDAGSDVVVEPYGTEQINSGGAGVGVTIGEGTYLRLVCGEDGLWMGSYFIADGTEAAAS